MKLNLLEEPTIWKQIKKSFFINSNNQNNYNKSKHFSLSRIIKNKQTKQLIYTKKKLKLQNKRKTCAILAYWPDIKNSQKTLKTIQQFCIETKTNQEIMFFLFMFFWLLKKLNKKNHKNEEFN